MSVQALHLIRAVCHLNITFPMIQGSVMTKPLRKNVVKCLLIRESLAELRSCLKVREDVLDSPSLIICMVSVDVKQRLKKKKKKNRLQQDFSVISPCCFSLLLQRAWCLCFSPCVGPAERCACSERVPGG